MHYDPLCLASQNSYLSSLVTTFLSCTFLSAGLLLLHRVTDNEVEEDKGPPSIEEVPVATVVTSNGATGAKVSVASLPSWRRGEYVLDL